jgi:hypothetical protein
MYSVEKYFSEVRNDEQKERGWGSIEKKGIFRDVELENPIN